MKRVRVICGRIGWRGFYVGVGQKHMLSCHLNGYGHGSQFALCYGDRWFGWWSDGGWAIKAQQPLKVTLSINGNEFEMQAPSVDDNEFVLKAGAAWEDSSTLPDGRQVIELTDGAEIYRAEFGKAEDA